MNFRVSSETPRIEAIQSGEGKKLIPRAHSYHQLGGYSIQNVTYSMEDGTWRLKRHVTVGLYHILRSLMAPGKQGPADDGKRCSSAFGRRKNRCDDKVLYMIGRGLGRVVPKFYTVTHPPGGFA